jgi:hypothetical protein
MRQFVAAIDPKKQKVRLLVPSGEFLKTEK